MHSHIVPPAILGSAGRHGPELEPIGGGVMRMRIGKFETTFTTVKLKEQVERGEEATVPSASKGDPQERIREMDEKAIDIMGVTAAPVFYFYWAEPEIAVPFVQRYNDALAEFCAAAPDRLFFMPTLPVQDIDASVAEIDRAVTQLGGKAINLGAQNLGPRELDSEDLWPLYAKAEELGVPLFIHPEPEAIFHQQAEDDAYHLGAIVGYCSQETVAFTRLVLGGVLDEFPNLGVYITHGGGFVPYQLGRIDRFARTTDDARNKRPVPDYLPNFYFDVLVHDVGARRFLIDTVGIDNVLVGDNFEGVDSADGFAFVDELDLDPDDKAKVESLNAAKLFNISLPTPV